MTLTSEQLSVVNLVSGRHLVLAPPGSGKTEMLSQRIIRALASGVNPKKMLRAIHLSLASTSRARFAKGKSTKELIGKSCRKMAVAVEPPRYERRRIGFGANETGKPKKLYGKL